MMQHYLKIKEQNKDCFVFYRLVIMKCFFDAIIVSKILDITLTDENGLENRAPMCGVLIIQLIVI